MGDTIVQYSDEEEGGGLSKAEMQGKAADMGEEWREVRSSFPNTTSNYPPPPQTQQLLTHTSAHTHERAHTHMVVCVYVHT